MKVTKDIVGILPPEQIMSGRPFFYLKDLKDSGSYKELSKTDKGTEFEISSQHIEGYLNLRTKEMKKVDSNFEDLLLWDIVEDLIGLSGTNSENPYTYISTKYLYIEADYHILSDVVPDGVRLSDGTMVFNNWTLPANSNQPIAISDDESRVILRLHLNNVPVNMQELKTWLEYSKTSNKNIKLLFQHEMEKVVSTGNYS